MASDLNKPFLRLVPQPQQDRPVGRPRPIPKPSGFSQDRQISAFSPKFDRLTDVLSRDPAGLELRTDPNALAPERLLVFEVRGAIATFAEAVRRVPGLELIDEEELEADEGDKAPIAYLMVPDVQALRDLESLWRRWLRGALVRGETPWRDVFALLRDLRPWGPKDRVQSVEADVLAESIVGLGDGDLVRLEIELVFRAYAEVGAECAAEIRAAVTSYGGRVVSASAYRRHRLPSGASRFASSAIRLVIERSPQGIAGLEPVMHIRPQSVASTIEVADEVESTVTPTVGNLGTQF